MELECLRYRQENVGKLIKNSKKKHFWELKFNNKKEVIEFTESFISNYIRVMIKGKKVVEQKLIDKRLKKKGIEFIQKGLKFKIFLNNDKKYNLMIEDRTFEPEKKFHFGDFGGRCFNTDFDSIAVSFKKPQIGLENEPDQYYTLREKRDDFIQKIKIKTSADKSKKNTEFDFEFNLNFKSSNFNLNQQDKNKLSFSEIQKNIKFTQRKSMAENINSFKNNSKQNIKKESMFNTLNKNYLLSDFGKDNILINKKEFKRSENNPKSAFNDVIKTEDKNLLKEVDLKKSKCINFDEIENSSEEKKGKKENYDYKKSSFKKIQQINKEKNFCSKLNKNNGNENFKTEYFSEIDPKRKNKTTKDNNENKNDLNLKNSPIRIDKEKEEYDYQNYFSNSKHVYNEDKNISKNKLKTNFKENIMRRSNIIVKHNNKNNFVESFVNKKTLSQKNHDLISNTDFIEDIKNKNLNLENEFNIQSKKNKAINFEEDLEQKILQENHISNKNVNNTEINENYKCLNFYEKENLRLHIKKQQIYQEEYFSNPVSKTNQQEAKKLDKYLAINFDKIIKRKTDEKLIKKDEKDKSQYDFLNKEYIQTFNCKKEFIELSNKKDRKTPFDEDDFGHIVENEKQKVSETPFDSFDF